jgi:uncharacterized protein (DUF1501 family)
MLNSRRHFLKRSSAFGLGSMAFSSSFEKALALAQDQIHRTHLTSNARLVVVMLRGAYDGLSAFYPYSDPNYQKLRPTIALGREAVKQTQMDSRSRFLLDDQFALHPSLFPLIPFWESRRFAFIPSVGLRKPYRSHFEAQHYMETGQEGKNSMANGWLNSLASLNRGSQMIGVGEANPEILRGQILPQLVPRGNAALQMGVLSNPLYREVLEDMYSRDEILSAYFASGEGSRVSTAMVLNQAKMKEEREQISANKDASPPSALLQDSKYLVTLMTQNPELRFGFLSTGGWDTHANQGNEEGALANNLRNLSESLAFLQNHLNEPDDIIVVLSEFGRTVRENVSKGTDHGFGNAMMIMGQRVNGGQRLGHWRGLAEEQLNEARDLPVFHDYRQVLSILFQKMFNLDKKQIGQIFPDFDLALCKSCIDSDLYQKLLLD